MTSHGPDGGSTNQDIREMTHAMLIALILLSVTLAAVAQLTLKHGVDRATSGSGALQFGAESLRNIASTPTVWIGLVLFGFSAVVWLGVLSRTSLSFAYPFASLTYVLILLADRFVLDQEVPILRYAGVVFIIIGIVLVAQTRHA